MKRVGLFVGIDKYKNGITQLKCAENDAKELSYAFNSAGFKVDFIHNEQCDCNTITRKIQSMLADLEPDDIFVFYFSGHGREHDGRHYLACVNSFPDSKLYDLDAYPISTLISLTDIPGLRRFFILDCCRSNILADKNGSFICESSRDIALNSAVVQNKDIGIIPPLILSSCSTGEQAFEHYETGHGYFTEALLQIIKDKSIRSFEQFQKSLNVVNTPKPQNVCWNGNISKWSDIILFKNWKNYPPQEQITNESAKYELPYLKNDIDTLLSGLKQKYSSEAEKKLNQANQAENDCNYAVAKMFFEQAKEMLQVELTAAQKRIAAEQGDATAQYKLGVCCTNGEGVPQDPKEAVFWYRKAAEQGDAQAQFNLGNCYRNGDGVQKDLAQAVFWYRKAAEQGYAQAQFNLGVCYKNGYGVQKDLTQAVFWWRKAAEQGYAQAQYNLGVCYRNGYGVQKDLAQAVFWYRKAAEQGDAQAQCNLGFCYENGDGVQKNLTQAVFWYRKAAEQGYAQAQYNLGECYRDGDGVQKDLKQAVFWFRKAAEQGDIEAQEALKKLNVSQ